jgi:hypothetical protein
LYGLRIVPLQDPDAASGELAAIKAAGLVGVEVGSHIVGHSIGDPALPRLLSRWTPRPSSAVSRLRDLAAARPKGLKPYPSLHGFSPGKAAWRSVYATVDEQHTSR